MSALCKAAGCSAQASVFSDFCTTHWNVDARQPNPQAALNEHLSALTAPTEPTHYRVAREAHETAGKLVQGDRRETHGDFIKNFEAIAALWNGFLLSRFGYRVGLKLTALDVADMMVLLKMGRTMNGKDNPDERVDLLGYGMIGAGLAGAEQENRGV